MAKDSAADVSTTVATRSRLREYTIGQSAPIEVDLEKGVLPNVLILGHSSRNRAEYPTEVMQEGVGRYDGAAVFVGHTRDGSSPDYDRKLGVIQKPHVTPEGIRGDLHFSPKHRLAAQLAWDATTNPQNIGLSHDADCTYQIRNGRKVVQKIERVFSVDLVVRPATTRGLFEDEEDFVASDPALKDLAETSFAAMDNARSIILDPKIPVASKRGRLAEAVAEWMTELKPAAPPEAPAGTILKEEETAMGVEYKDITVEALTKERPDLVAQFQGTDDKSRMTEEVKTLKATVASKDAELATLKAAEAKRMKEAEIAAELTEAKFPIADEVVYSAKFRESLAAAPDKAARDEIIKDRMEVSKGRVQEQHVGSVAPLTNLRPIPATTPVDKAKEQRFFG